MIQDYGFLPVLLWEVHVVDVFWLTGWLCVWAVVWTENLSVLQFQYLKVPKGPIGFTCGPFSLNFHSLRIMCNMHSLERHVIQCEHWHTSHLHQHSDILVCHGRWCFLLYFLGGNMMFLSMLNVKLWVLFLSDAGIVCSSCIQYKLSVCHAPIDELRRLEKNSTPKLFQNIVFILYYL